MQTRRKILFAVAALALPFTGFAVFGTPSIFAGATQPEYPVACNVAGTVTFTPALTQTGTTATKTALTTATITVGKLAGCLSAAYAGAPTKGVFPPAPATSVSFAIPATKVGTQYVTGYCPGFLSSALKALKGFPLDIAWTQGVGGTSDFTTKKATAAANNTPEQGFSLTGSEPLDNAYYEKPLDQVTLFIDKADSAILTAGCSADQIVTSVTFDKGNSTAIL